MGQTLRLDRAVVATLIVVMLASLAHVATPVARAATTITVTTPLDELNSDGDCSLREAVIAANTDQTVDACPAGSGADTINLPGGTYARLIAGTGEDAAATGDLDITADLTINGAGQNLTRLMGAGGSRERLFDVFAPATVKLRRMTITEGRALDGASQKVGGGIRNAGNLTLWQVTLSNNQAATAGGGIFSTGTLVLISCYLSDNQSLPGSTGGGGIAVRGGRLELRSSTLWHNTGYQGGGVNVVGTSTARIPVVIENSTIGRNRARNANGGGAYIEHSTVSINNTTISLNDHGELGQGGGMFLGDGALVRMRNTIVAENHAGEADGEPSNCVGKRIKSLGYNLVGRYCAMLSQPTDQRNMTEPRLVEAAPSGLGRVFVPMPGSPAIDAGSPSISGSDACLPTDQLGVARPQDGDGDTDAVCDIGAFEVVVD